MRLASGRLAPERWAPVPTPGLFYLIGPTGSIPTQDPSFSWDEAMNASDYMVVIYDVGLGNIFFSG